MKADNANVKVIFVVRNPIERTESHYRYGFEMKTFAGGQKDGSSIDALIDLALDESRGGLPRLYDMAVAALESTSLASSLFEFPNERIDSLVDQFLKGFHSNVDRNYQKAASILSHSLYFPAIYNWMRVVGKDNVKVVALDWFSPNKLPLEYRIKKLEKHMDANLTLIPDKEISKLFTSMIFKDLYRYVQ